MREHITFDVYQETGQYHVMMLPGVFPVFVTDGKHIHDFADDFLAHDRIRSRLPTLPPGQSGLVRLKVLTPNQAQQDLATWILLVRSDSEQQCWVIDFSKGCKCCLGEIVGQNNSGGSVAVTQNSQVELCAFSSGLLVQC